MSNAPEPITAFTRGRSAKWLTKNGNISAAGFRIGKMREKLIVGDSTVTIYWTDGFGWTVATHLPGSEWEKNTTHISSLFKARNLTRSILGIGAYGAKEPK